MSAVTIFFSFARSVLPIGHKTYNNIQLDYRFISDTSERGWGLRRVKHLIMLKISPFSWSLQTTRTASHCSANIKDYAKCHALKLYTQTLGDILKDISLRFICIDTKIWHTTACFGTHAIFTVFCEISNYNELGKNWMAMAKWTEWHNRLLIRC